MDIVENIKYPTTDSEWIKKILIGGILLIIPIINFIIGGYYIKTLRGSIEGKPGLPEWDEWGDLFITGLMVAIIGFIYMLIPLIVLFVSIGGALTAAISSGDFSAASISAIVGGSLFSVLLMLIVYLVLPMALSIYAKEDSIGAAFRIGEILSRIKSVPGDYIISIIVLYALLFIVNLVAAIPILGWVIVIFANFYITLVASKMFGEVYASSNA
jgi:Protein of unknown function (DUF4013)